MTSGLKLFFQQIVIFLLFCFNWLLIWFYRLTCRIEVVGDLDAVMNQPDPVLLAGWHQDMLCTFSYLTRYARRRPIAVLVSRSKDGEVAAGVLSWFGFVPIRGSSSRGGAAALAQLCDRVKIDRSIAAIICDGPRPPARVAKPGIITLSRLTGRPIFLLRSWSTRQHIFEKSWPRLALVLPFSRIVVMIEGPLSVPPRASDEEQERLRLELQDRLNRLAEASEKYFIR
ncbi:MAG TPA: lysophospholipid acyltransferase family protein [Nitrospiria bacterium]|jgi:lysophospholipid acyltransferase (LPLAT)-like uncharacterized protein|nr:lysophospholipid acyltransferase family protein [Nitrospiria bacterium]